MWYLALGVSGLNIYAPDAGSAKKELTLSGYFDQDL
jgi:hypothetical protein